MIILRLKLVGAALLMKLANTVSDYQSIANRFNAIRLNESR